MGRPSPSVESLKRRRTELVRRKAEEIAHLDVRITEAEEKADAKRRADLDSRIAAIIGALIRENPAIVAGEFRKALQIAFEQRGAENPEIWAEIGTRFGLEPARHPAPAQLTLEPADA